MDKFCGTRGKIHRRGTPALRGRCLVEALTPQPQPWPRVVGTFCAWLVDRIYFCSVVSFQLDSDRFDDVNVEPALKGFRKRWLSGKRTFETESSGPSSEDLHGHPVVPVHSHLFGGSDVESLDFAGAVGDVDFAGHLDDAC